MTQWQRALKSVEVALLDRLINGKMGGPSAQGICARVIEVELSLTLSREAVRSCDAEARMMRCRSSSNDPWFLRTVFLIRSHRPAFDTCERRERCEYLGDFRIVVKIELPLPKSLVILEI